MGWRGLAAAPAREFLREALETVSAAPRPDTAAGATPAGPRAMRVWWDLGLVNVPGDVLADIDRPVPVLRFYDVTGTTGESSIWSNFFDVDVSLGDGGRKIDFWSADRRYLIELGLRSADGRFVCLARANSCELPRDRAGHDSPVAIARTMLSAPPSGRRPIGPEAEDVAWAESGRDWESRDVQAEAALRCVYRLFATEGPKVFRRFPRPERRSGEALRREYAERCSRRSRSVKAGLDEPSPRGQRFLVERIDGAPAPSRVPAPMLPVLAPGRWLRVDGDSKERYSFNRGLLAASRRASEKSFSAMIATPVEDGPIAPAWKSRPVREVAERLSPAALRRKVPESVPPEGARSETRPASGIGGFAERGLSRAGVRVEAASLTLCGRARPGTKLRVAGKLVQTDADGRFRVECELSGRNSLKLPLQILARGRVAAGGAIRVEWEDGCGGVGFGRRK